MTPMKLLYKVIRTKYCSVNVPFYEYDYEDINVAHKICQQYSDCFCRERCGCQFEVVENLGPIISSGNWWSPESFTLTMPSPIYTNPYTYTLDGSTYIINSNASNNTDTITFTTNSNAAAPTITTSATIKI